MAQEVQAFSATIPAGTPQSAPVAISLAMPPRVVRRIEWKVPPGPKGNMGFQIGMAGTQLIPYSVGAFIVADDDSEGWDLVGLPSSGAWQLLGYNTGIFAHTVYLRFLVDLPSDGTAAAAALIPAAALGGSAA